jgi:hypothetical protein
MLSAMKNFTKLLECVYTIHTWAEDMAPQGCDQSADQRPECEGGGKPPPRRILAPSDKSREREGRAFASIKALFLSSLHSAAAILVRQLFGPHFRTWP